MWLCHCSEVIHTVMRYVVCHTTVRLCHCSEVIHTVVRYVVCCTIVRLCHTVVRSFIL